MCVQFHRHNLEHAIRRNESRKIKLKSGENTRYSQIVRPHS